ncbi:MAG: type III pantothenate kinase [Sulfurovum sp.]|nr:type III pantothenate kinase [Sulfurovum sp.]
MLLADIGNTHFHIYDGTSIEHLSYEDAFIKYAHKTLKYICVNPKIEKKLEQMDDWENIADLLTIQGEYDTMGVDRKALVLSHKSGLFVDAGSAITVDVVKEGIYKGGFILPGLKAYQESYKNISSVLDYPLNTSLSLAHLGTTTKEQISYGIIASIKALIDQHSKGHTLYFTGGDGKFLATFFEEANYDETLVFLGMQHVLNKG